MSDKKKYYDISEAWDDVIFESETTDKLKAGAKFIGKLGFNALRFAGGVAIEAAKQAPTEVPKTIIRNYERMLEQPGLPVEKRAKIEQKLVELREKYPQSS